MAVKVYGIKNCNTMKKTFQLFEKEGMDYEFVDYKKQAPTADLLQGFLKKISLDELVNRKGTTYKKLSDNEKAATLNVDSAIPILQEKSSMIKRPIIVFKDGNIHAGLNEEAILAKK
ncbi:Spx/MgsR family RNA polymerase-binding regulatory protein [Lunatibacter salilacus]|uniref:Spx/MgsR family RNA polymerase-binding regulatory protein n=1 Tax=Lunatibacter salilacus TaxID=2483804 RepID=UPI00131ECD76|nr:Spx/MgsR family RNA polymerase-binding regulatory protein [Lunatibacter salilacus]